MADLVAKFLLLFVYIASVNNGAPSSTGELRPPTASAGSAGPDQTHALSSHGAAFSLSAPHVRAVASAEVSHPPGHNGRVEAAPDRPREQLVVHSLAQGVAAHPLSSPRVALGTRIG